MTYIFREVNKCTGNLVKISVVQLLGSLNLNDPPPIVESLLTFDKVK